MKAVAKKFRPLIEGSLWRLKQNIVSFQSAKPAPPCWWIKWWCSLLSTPCDGVWSAALSEGLDVRAESCWAIAVINHLPHMLIVSHFEAHSTASICFYISCVCLCYPVPVHNITIFALSWHGAVGFVDAIAKRCSPLLQFFVC